MRNEVESGEQSKQYFRLEERMRRNRGETAELRWQNYRPCLHPHSQSDADGGNSFYPKHLTLGSGLLLGYLWISWILMSIVGGGQWASLLFCHGLQNSQEFFGVFGFIIPASCFVSFDIWFLFLSFHYKKNPIFTIWKENKISQND